MINLYNNIRLNKKKILNLNKKFYDLINYLIYIL